MECTDGLLGITVGLVSIAVTIRHNRTISITKIEMFLRKLVPIFENQIVSRICGIHFYSKTNIPFTMWESMSEEKRKKINIQENVIVLEIFRYQKYDWFSPLDLLNTYQSLLTFQYERKTDVDDFSFQTHFSHISTLALIIVTVDNHFSRPDFLYVPLFCMILRFLTLKGSREVSSWLV